MKQSRKLTTRARELRHNSTPTELRLWYLLRDRRMMGFKFRRQQPYAGYVLDFYCAKAALVVELDGESHLGKEEADAKRQQDLEKRGLKVLRYWDTEVFENSEGVLEEVWRECVSRTLPDQGRKCYDFRHGQAVQRSGSSLPFSIPDGSTRTKGTSISESLRHEDAASVTRPENP